MGEILLLAAIALIVIGPKQLPEFARQVGKVLNELKRAAGSFSEELKHQASQIKVEEIPPHAPVPDENLPVSEKKDDPKKDSAT